MVKPAVKRRQVQHLVDAGLVSERRACGLIGISRSVVQYQGVNRYDGDLRVRLKALAERYPRYGYLMLHALLRQEGLVVNARAFSDQIEPVNLARRTLKTIDVEHFSGQSDHKVIQTDREKR